MTGATTSVDVVAIAGIAGTLLGTALGAWVTWKIQQRQLEHEDRTRFHDRRLAVYAEFADASNAVMAALLTGNNWVNDLQRVVGSFASLRLVASTQVFHVATPVHTAVTDAVHGRIANLQAFMPQFNNSAAQMSVAMRAELGIK